MVDGTVWGLNADAATSLARQNGGQIMLDPRQQADLARQQALRDAQDQQRILQQNATFGLQQGNQISNLNTERAMALNAQANAAANVANQLTQLGQARANNVNAINNAMSSAASLAR
jgi:hypothetical protein